MASIYLKLYVLIYFGMILFVYPFWGGLLYRSNNNSIPPREGQVGYGNCYEENGILPVDLGVPLLGSAVPVMSGYISA